MTNTQTNSQKETQYTTWFLVVAGVFITCLIVANIIAVKVIIIADQFLPAAIVIFPISYIVGDVLTEVYGYRKARTVIWLGFLCNLIAVIAIWIGQQLPGANPQVTDAYNVILGKTGQILIASFVAYLVGEFANAFVLAKMKIAMKGKWLWARTIGSTLIGQGLDSLVFLPLAGILPVEALPSAIVTQWLVKSAYEAIATPLTYAVVTFLKRKEGIDVYDTNTNFNPLMIAE